MFVQNVQWLLENTYVLLFSRTFVGLVLLTAGIVKLRDRRQFTEIVRGYELLPQSMTSLVGQLLPVIEIAVAVWLLSGVLLPWSALIACGLFVMFCSVVMANLLRGRRDIVCGCFGPKQEQRLGWTIVARNFVLILLTILSSQSHTEVLSFGEIVVIGLMASVAFGLWNLWGLLSTFLSPLATRHLHQ